MIMGGSMATTAVAAICPQKTPVEAKKLMVPTGKVVVLCLLSASGKITLFQLKTKVNIEVTIMPGKASGMIIGIADRQHINRGVCLGGDAREISQGGQSSGDSGAGGAAHTQEIAAAQILLGHRKLLLSVSISQ